MAKYVWIGAFALLLAGNASATTSTFDGGAGWDVIRVGRGYDAGSNFVYVACVNGEWEYDALVTGSSDTVTVNGNGGSDVIVVQGSTEYYYCGETRKWIFSMSYGYSCPNVYINGGTGNDRINGAQCAEHLYGDAGADSIWGGAGNDWIYGGTENDCIDDETLSFLSCGSGSDGYTDDYLWKDCENQVAFCLLPP
jgi:Ca2+-binding RTX toxin-like protein